MPLFKKFIIFFSIVLIILLVAYLLMYTYSTNNGNSYALIKDYSKVLSYGLKDLYHSLILQFIDSFSDTIVYIFTFHYNNITTNVRYFLLAIVISSFPFWITLFQFLTYRGFQAFKLRIKKAKANPFYYRDYVEANKDFGNDNIEETDLSLLPLLIPLRLLVIVLVLLTMPVIILIYFIFELIGLFRGITNTGKALDFE